VSKDSWIGFGLAAADGRNDFHESELWAETVSILVSDESNNKSMT
jgi:hypothetical protein